MQEVRLITEVSWTPGQGFDPRASSVFSNLNLVRLTPDHCVKLKVQANNQYPTDPDIWVRSHTHRPGAVRQLLALQLDATTPDGTSVGLRVWNGSRDLFWDGAAWSEAGPGDWNTEAEVNQHLASLDVATSRAFALTFNLRTTDGNVTPEVLGAAVLWRGPVDWQEDLLVDSLLGSLREGLDYVEELALPPLTEEAEEIDLSVYTDEAALELVGADAAFDDTADPSHLVNLLTSYDPATKLLALSAPIPEGHVPLLRMLARSTVAWGTQQDFEEVGRLPQVVLTQVETPGSTQAPAGARASVVRRDTEVGTVLPAPLRMNFRIQLEVRTDRTRGQQRLQEALLRFFLIGPAGEVGPFLRSRATDRRYRLRILDEFRAIESASNAPDVRVHLMTFAIEDVAMHLRPAFDAPVVAAFCPAFKHVPAEGEVRATAAGAPVPASPPETFQVN